MSNVSRRDFLNVAGIAGGLIASAGLVPQFASFTSQAQSNGLIGKIVVTRTGPISVHTYIAPEGGLRVTSHAIETANRLLVVDTQLLKGSALEAQSYFESLGKPIDRVYISHAHIDHFAGAENFDAPLLSTPGVVTGINEYIENTGTAVLEANLPADQVPQTLLLPEATVEAGSETIDGVTFEFDIVLDTEAPEQIVIRVPEAGVIVLQDLLYNNTHMSPLGNNENWISELNALRALQSEGYDTLLAGHGVPTTFGEIDAMIDYLNTMEELITGAESPEAAIAALVERYPSHDGQVILGFLVPFRFQS